MTFSNLKQYIAITLINTFKTLIFLSAYCQKQISYIQGPVLRWSTSILSIYFSSLKSLMITCFILLSFLSLSSTFLLFRITLFLPVASEIQFVKVLRAKSLLLLLLVWRKLHAGQFRGQVEGLIDLISKKKGALDNLINQALLPLDIALIHWSHLIDHRNSTKLSRVKVKMEILWILLQHVVHQSE